MERVAKDTDVFATLQRFNDVKEAYDKIAKNYENAKKTFYEFGDKLFEDTEENVLCYCDDTVANCVAKVKKVQSTSVEYDTKGIEKLLKQKGKNTDAIIDRQIYIPDFNGFIDFLKSIGAKPDDIKKYITTVKSVNVDKLNRARELGIFTYEELSPYKITKQKSRYYKVSFEGE